MYVIVAVDSTHDGFEHMIVGEGTVITIAFANLVTLR